MTGKWISEGTLEDNLDGAIDGAIDGGGCVYSRQDMKSISVQEYHKLRNKIWNDLVYSKIISDRDDIFTEFDAILGMNLSVSWD